MMGVQQKPVRDDAHKPVLDLARRFARRDGEAVGEAEDVGVDGQRRLAEDGVEHHIRGLAANPGQRLQRLAVARRLAAVPFDDGARERDDVPGLGPIEPDRLDEFGEPLLAERRHLFRRVGEGEQRRRRPVHARVRRLRRQHHRHQQSERVDVFELALRGRIGRGQSLEDRLGPRRPSLPGLLSRHRPVIGARLRASQAQLSTKAQVAMRSSAKHYARMGLGHLAARRRTDRGSGGTE